MWEASILIKWKHIAIPEVVSISGTTHEEDEWIMSEFSSDQEFETMWEPTGIFIYV